MATEDEDKKLEEIRNFSTKYTGTEKSPIPNLLASLVLSCPNFLMLIPSVARHSLIFILYNVVIIFLLVSGISMFKFSSVKP